MGYALSELPLAIFTTLVPIGAGGFFALALAFLTTNFPTEQLKKLDKLAFIPLGIVVIGLIASFAHLLSPMNTLHVFEHVGTSPLSNEIVAAIVFIVVTLIYCIFAVMGFMGAGLRKVSSVIVALVALTFAVFTGLAYAVETVPTWDTSLTPIEIVGYFLIGGALLGGLLVKWSGGYHETQTKSFKMVMGFVMFAGFVLAITSVIARYMMVSGMNNALINGAELAGDLMIYLVAFLVLMVIALVLGFLGLRRQGSMGLFVSGLIAATGAVFIGRLMFYAMQVSVGIQVVL